MSSSIDKVREQITLAKSDAKTPDHVDMKEAMSIVRSAVGMGVTSADIKVAIAKSGLPKEEKKLLTDALGSVPKNDVKNHTVSAKADLIIGSNASWSGKDSGHYKLSAIVQKDKVVVSVKEAEGEFDQSMRERMFDTSLAQAYGLDPAVAGSEGLTKQLYEKIQANPEIAAARKAFIYSTAPIKADHTFTIPLPTID